MAGAATAGFQGARREALLLIILSAACLLVFVFALRLWQADFQVPFTYIKGDVLYSNLAVKTVIETGWFHHNPWLGAPAESELHDFFQPYGVNYLLVHVFSLLTGGDWVASLNLFILFTYILSAWAAWFLFRSLGLAPLYAGAASLLFAFLPYHLIRGNYGHLFLSSYFVVPLATWLALQVASDSPPFSSLRSSWLALLVVVVMSNSGIYYAFFGCFLVLVAGIIASTRYRVIKNLRAAVIAVSLCGLLVFLTMLPTMQYIMQEGANQVLGARNAAESEILGLKIFQLLLPTTFHAIPFLHSLAYEYKVTAPLVNENTFAYLGFIGAAGFLALLLFFFMRKPFTLVSRHFETLAQFNLGLLLLSTIGGFGAMFAWLVSPAIRGYNRSSIFIACLAIGAAFLLLQYVASRFREKPAARVVLPAAVLVLLGAGLIDILSTSRAPDHAAMASQFRNDAAFVASIDDLLHPGAMVYQAPHSGFPEGDLHHNEALYGHAIGYLHSRDLRWSYGAIKGRNTDRWLAYVDRLPTGEKLRYLQTAGFSGIYIDRRGYSDGAARLEQELANALSASPLVSPDNRLSFFPLNATGSRLLPAYADADFRLVSGFWEWEGRPGEHAWAKGDAEMVIESGSAENSPGEADAKGSFILWSLVERDVAVFVNGTLLGRYSLSPGQKQAVQFSFPPGGATVRLGFETDRPAVSPADIDSSSTDRRKLAFAVDEVSVSY